MTDMEEKNMENKNEKKDMTLAELRDFINNQEDDFIINVDMGELLDDKERKA